MNGKLTSAINLKRDFNQANRTIKLNEYVDIMKDISGL